MTSPSPHEVLPSSSAQSSSSSSLAGHLLPVVTFIPIHAYPHAIAQSPNYLSSWHVTCRPAELIRIGSRIAVIYPRHSQYLCGEVRGVRAVEQHWIEFWVSTYTGRDILLSIPSIWASVPFPFSLFHHLCRTWLLDTSAPLVPGQLPAIDDPWEHCTDLQRIVGHRTAQCKETDLREWQRRG